MNNNISARIGGDYMLDVDVNISRVKPISA